MQREALLRTAVHGDSHEQVASALGLSHAAVRGLVHRARVAMRTAAGALSPTRAIQWLGPLRARRAAGAPELGTGGARPGGGMLAALAKGGAVLATGGVLVTGLVAVHAVTPVTPGHSHRPWGMYRLVPRQAVVEPCLPPPMRRTAGSRPYRRLHALRAQSRTSRGQAPVRGGLASRRPLSLAAAVAPPVHLIPVELDLQAAPVAVADHTLNRAHSTHRGSRRAARRRSGESPKPRAATSRAAACCGRRGRRFRFWRRRLGPPAEAVKRPPSGHDGNSGGGGLGRRGSGARVADSSAGAGTPPGARAHILPPKAPRRRWDRRWFGWRSRRGGQERTGRRDRARRPGAAGRRDRAGRIGPIGDSAGTGVAGGSPTEPSPHRVPEAPALHRCSYPRFRARRWPDVRLAITRVSFRGPT